VLATAAKAVSPLVPRSDTALHKNASGLVCGFTVFLGTGLFFVPFFWAGQFLGFFLVPRYFEWEHTGTGILSLAAWK
jgi:hypothetical protein